MDRLTGAKLPLCVEEIFRRFWTCEFTTLARDGTPVTWPVMAMFLPARRRFVIGTPIGCAQKAINIRRDPRVALLFSDPTGSGLSSPGAALVQGVAEAPEAIICSPRDVDEETLAELLPQMRRVVGAQPLTGLLFANPLARRLMDWYFMRLIITVTPRRILFWECGDFSLRPVEVTFVETD